MFFFCATGKISAKSTGNLCVIIFKKGEGEF